MSKKILIFSSGTESSVQAEKTLREKLDKEGFKIVKEIDDDVELIVCIGGDGTFLQAVHKFDFPKVPFLGINTGHLGFFQEIMPKEIEGFIINYSKGKYRLQHMQAVHGTVTRGKKEESFTGLNEILVKSNANSTIHLDISIGGGFIEKFSGDGILISTPAGSTAYNSLGGSIVDPRLSLLQITPIAPMNTIAYRSFTSSILLPPDLSLGVVPDQDWQKGGIKIAFDGFSKEYDSIDKIEIKLSDKIVDLVRFETYDFWDKVKSKFL